MLAELKQPHLIGLWNWQEMDSGTGSIVFKASSVIGPQAVKWFALEGSESLTEADLQLYKSQTHDLAQWVNGLREDLRSRTFTEKNINLKITWNVNRIHAVGTSNGHPFTVSNWAQGIPCADIIEDASVSESISPEHPTAFSRWIAEEIQRMGRLYRFEHAYSSPRFIPVARNILLSPVSGHTAILTVVDIRDYIHTAGQPISSFAKRRAKLQT